MKHGRMSPLLVSTSSTSLSPKKSSSSSSNCCITTPRAVGARVAAVAHGVARSRPDAVDHARTDGASTTSSSGSVAGIRAIIISLFLTFFWSRLCVDLGVEPQGCTVPDPIRLSCALRVCVGS